MKIRLNTDTHASERHQRGQAPRALMYNIQRLNELYRELDEILATVKRRPDRLR